VDIFVHWAGINPNELAEKLKQIESNNVKLTMITNRGIRFGPMVLKKPFVPTTGDVGLNQNKVLRCTNQIF
jgi:hypothetical protein